LNAAGEKGWSDEKDVVLETSTCVKRAVADYFGILWKLEDK